MCLRNRRPPSWSETPIRTDTVEIRYARSYEHCNHHVSEQFARVFADARGDVHACPNCASNAGIAEVAMQRAPTT
ncbi:hypothetical protein BRC64_10475 [Halobacteriales archaeon QH_10_67_22]|nr:MAG: hypothetical protein BRC64_10475 [Halobacteriales archaeon QH_10_67_22]